MKTKKTNFGGKRHRICSKIFCKQCFSFSIFSFLVFQKQNICFGVGAVLTPLAEKRLKIQ
jgi:hypothetical protein